MLIAQCLDLREPQDQQDQQVLLDQVEQQDLSVLLDNLHLLVQQDRQVQLDLQD